MGLDCVLVGSDSQFFTGSYQPVIEKVFAALKSDHPDLPAPAIGTTAGEDLSGRVGSYGAIHYLRHYAAHLAINGCPPENPFQDGKHPLLEDVYRGRYKIDKFRHLIEHSDCDGFYVPIDFPDPVSLDVRSSEFAEEEEAQKRSWFSRIFLIFFPQLNRSALTTIGSSQRLLAELDELNLSLKMKGDLGQLGQDQCRQMIEDDPWHNEKWVWATLHWLARESVERSLILEFC